MLKSLVLLVFLQSTLKMVKQSHIKVLMGLITQSTGLFLTYGTVISALLIQLLTQWVEAKLSKP
jgi:uncharacterized membrane protein